MKLYFFPSEPKGGATNPYSQNYKKAIAKYVDVVDETGVPLALNYPFLHFAFRADVFILNWIESAVFSKNGYLKFFIILFALCVIRLRRKKIVWMFHNLRPHEGENAFSKFLQNFLFRSSSLIVAHSKDACDYAKKRAKCEVLFFAHPVAIPLYEKYSREVPSCDVLIWGSVLPYKGILEFISMPQVQQSLLRIRVIGTCKDVALSTAIEENCNDLIMYENRRIGFSELKAAITKSRYVLFPYIGSSVSSSGALIDTICLGGVPVGPNKGAFKDLEREGVCLTYKNDDEMMDILLSEQSFINEFVRQDFIKNNSWQSFAQKINDKILNVL